VAAFQHDARYYLEILRVPSLTPAIFEKRVVVETPETVEAAFAGGPVIFVSALVLTYGSLFVLERM